MLTHFDDQECFKRFYRYLYYVDMYLFAFSYFRYITNYN